MDDAGPVARTIRNNPWKSRSEYLVDEALKSALIPEEEIRAMRPIAAPQNPFPERTGFLRDEWNIEEVLNIDRRNPSYRTWVSGFIVERSPLADDTGANGSSRNSMGAMW